MLSFKNISKQFGGVKAVNNCLFEIEKGKITALIGPNGAGKSTLFNLISGIIKPDSGEIRLNRESIGKKSIEQISNLGIARIFQQSSLFQNLTVKENLLLAMDGEDEKFWKNLLCGNSRLRVFEDKISEMLQKINMDSHKNTVSRDLSFGQKRLVELARAILNPHIFLMLDEPVAGVNPKLREKIKEILIDLKNQGETILLIEHDMGFTLSIADRVIVLDGGRVIVEGSPREIRENPKVMDAYLG